MPGSTIIDMPFVYRLDYLPFRARTSQSWMMIRDDVPVTIPTYSADEAPVAIEMSRHDLVAKRGRELYPDGAPVTYHRLVDGRLFESLAYAGFPAVTLDAFTADMERAAKGGAICSGWQTSKLPKLGKNLGDETSVYLPYERTFRDQPPRQILASDQVEKRNLAVERFGRDLAVIDGAIWVHQEKAEPHYVVKEAVGRTVILTLEAMDQPHSEISTFRLDRLDDATAFAVRLAEKRGGELVQQLPDVMVYDEDALQRDDVIEIGRQVLAATMRGFPWGISRNNENRAAVELVDLKRLMDDMTRAEAARAIHLASQVHDAWGGQNWFSHVIDRWRTAEAAMHFVVDEAAEPSIDDEAALRF